MTDAIRLDDENVVGYLRSVDVLEASAGAACQPAGDGNINWVRRVRAADGRSWIVKQARPTLEKFPEYKADPARLVYEARYFEIARRCDEDGVLPQVVHFDEANHVLVLQDLGDVPRMGEILAAGRGLDKELGVLAGFLGRVHATTAGDAGLPSRFTNEQMRRLHGDHIFYLPFRANDFDLEPPLRKRAQELWGDDDLVVAVDGYYRHYLDPVGALVHADVQSSNILVADRGPILLDGEIAHVGDPAFDVGTLVAHVYLPALAREDVPVAAYTSACVWERYIAERPGTGSDVERVAAYAAIEMIRRTIGAARVPPMRDTAAALRCLDFATSVIRREAALF